MALQVARLRKDHAGVPVFAALPPEVQEKALEGARKQDEFRRLNGEKKKKFLDTRAAKYIYDAFVERILDCEYYRGVGFPVHVLRARGVTAPVAELLGDVGHITQTVVRGLYYGICCGMLVATVEDQLKVEVLLRKLCGGEYALSSSGSSLPSTCYVCIHDTTYLPVVDAAAQAPAPAQPSCVQGVDDLQVEPWSVPAAPAPGHVRVQMKAVGICGSDIHYWKRGRIADFVVREPMVIGHESAGTVAAVAEGVVGLAVGDRVALEPGVPCWSHPACRVGRYNLDPDIKFFATPPFHGSLAKFVDHPADWCYKLPENMSHEEGAMCEPLSVGIHACQRGGVGPGKRVAILGAGPIGLVALLAAKAFGADVVAICDLKPHNLQLAKQLGASYTHQSGIGELPQATAEALKQGAGVPGGFEVVIDCAGFEATMRAAIKACTSGGRIVLVGMGQEEMKLPVVEASIREVDIMGSFRYCNTYPLCIQLIASGRVDVKPLITHRFGFSQQAVLDGFGTAHRADETGAIKVMFNI